MSGPGRKVVFLVKMVESQPGYGLRAEGGGVFNAGPAEFSGMQEGLSIVTAFTGIELKACHNSDFS